jgi:CubicO group peptidase (beta-lactamase class C family)
MAGPARTVSRRLAEAVSLLEEAAREPGFAAVLQVSAGTHTLVREVGAARGPDTVFLLASITKPMTAAGVMALVERGQLSLDDPVRKHLPELAGPGVSSSPERAALQIRHLLDHTSGLPDMVPSNLELRKRHAPLSAFLAEALVAPLEFAPGSRVRYQSSGFLLAATIVERLTGAPFREHLRKALFAPLGMKATSLGLGGRRVEDTARCQVPDDPGGWNSPYWRDLGSPWGGAHGTAADLVRLLRFFAHPGRGGPLRAATVETMLHLQTPPGKERYGLGWRLGMGGAASSERTFGHGGATGTLCWFDPARDLAFVLLTTSPSAQSNARLLTPVSNLLSEGL